MIASLCTETMKLVRKRGLATLSHRLPVEALAVYDDGGANQATAAEAAGLPLSRILGLSAGDSIAFGPSVRIAVLHPPSGDQSEDENRTSLVLRVEVEGVPTQEVLIAIQPDRLGAHGVGLPAAAQTEIKFGHVGEPGSLFAQSAEEFARRANAKLGSKAKVVVYGSSQLGGDKEMIQKVKLGTLEMAVPSTVMSSEVDLIGIFEMPYIVKDRAHMQKIEKEMDAEFTQLRSAA